MEEKNYVLAESFNRANIQKRLWYVMDTEDIETLTSEETLIFGDRIYIIKEATYGIMGNDGKVYSMSDGSEITTDEDDPNDK